MERVGREKRQRATRLDLVIASGVRPIAISMALRGYPVNPGVLARVNAAVLKTGYTGSDTKHLNVGVIIPDTTEPYSSFASNIALYAHCYDILTLTAPTGWEVGNVEKITLELSRRALGVVVVDPTDPAILTSLAKEKVSAVVVDITPRRHFNVQGVGRISVDQKAAGFKGATYLLEHGASEISYLVRRTGSFDDYQKIAGIEEVLGHKVDVYYPELHREPVSAAYDQAKLILQRQGQKVEGIITSDDLVGIGAVRFLRESGVRIPEDMSVLSLGLSEVGDFTDPRFSGTIFSLSGLAWESLEMLFNEIQEQRVFTPFLLIQQSTN